GMRRKGAVRLRGRGGLEWWRVVWWRGEWGMGGGGCRKGGGVWEERMVEGYGVVVKGSVVEGIA
ncbi:hypothetical protein, partial [Corynebacterium glyciniphilum]|uniref:hypothetical protein n=1 Tax=Corynebacterium glyciniphilum TaxID=1404244 RepID=UPI001C92D982